MTDEHVARRHDGTSARVDRRGFLQLGLAGGLSSVVAACGWDGGNAVRPLLLDVSRLNDWVGEKILFSQHRLAPQYDIAERATHLPSYFISPMMPMLRDPAAWRLQVGGLVRQPLTLSIDDLQAMPRTTYTVKHHCVEGWSAILAYGMNDNPLPASHGAPLRLYSPTKLGYKMTKYLVSVTFTAERPGGYWEDQGYPWFAGV